MKLLLAGVLFSAKSGIIFGRIGLGGYVSVWLRLAGDP
jgi:hypothetical protein